jgi:hypothetical protein
MLAKLGATLFEDFIENLVGDPIVVVIAHY